MFKFLLTMSKLLTATDDFKNPKLIEVANKCNEILQTIAGPIFIALGGAGAIYIVVLGVQFARSESQEKRQEVKTRLINCIIGVLVILGFATMFMLIDWVQIVQIFGYASVPQQ